MDLRQLHSDFRVEMPSPAVGLVLNRCHAAGTYSDVSETTGGFRSIKLCTIFKQ